VTEIKILIYVIKCSYFFPGIAKKWEYFDLNLSPLVNPSLKGEHNIPKYACLRDLDGRSAYKELY
jgi:hypothetical protein